jgi:hypothetical protein
MLKIRTWSTRLIVVIVPVCLQVLQVNATLKVRVLPTHLVEAIVPVY